MSEFDFREIETEEKDEVEKVEESQVEVEDTKKDDDEYEKICFVCRRPESVTGKMIDLPNNISVCNDNTVIAFAHIVCLSVFEAKSGSVFIRKYRHL